MAKYIAILISTMLFMAVGCSAPDNSNNLNPANTDGSLCRGKADCPTPLDASNGADNDTNGTTDDTTGVDNDNGGNTDVVADPCAGFEVLATQQWECHYGKVVKCVPECINNGVDAPYILCGGGVSFIPNTVFVPSVSNPTEVQMEFDGGSTCYNLNH